MVTRAIWVYDLNSLPPLLGGGGGDRGDYGLGLWIVGKNCRSSAKRFKVPRCSRRPFEGPGSMSAEVSIEMEVPAPNPGAINEALLLSLILPNTVTYRTRQHQKQRKWK